MYLSRLTFQTNTVRHQNITKLKCQDVKLDQLSRGQNEKVKIIIIIIIIGIIFTVVTE